MVHPSVVCEQFVRFFVRFSRDDALSDCETARAVTVKDAAPCEAASAARTTAECLPLFVVGRDNGRDDDVVEVVASRDACLERQTTLDLIESLVRVYCAM
jgi:hypothetical protein